MEHKKQIDYERELVIEILRETTSEDLIHFVHSFASNFLGYDEVRRIIMKSYPDEGETEE